MQDQPVFKKATFGGFDKKSVITYIHELNTATQEAQERLQAQIDEVTASREQLRQSLQQLEVKLQSTKREREDTATELRQEKARSGELDQLIESLRGEQKRQQEIIREKDEEIDRHIQEKDRLRQRNRTLEEKRLEVEQASIHIGELLLRTRTESEQLITNSTTQAQRNLAKAGEQAEEILSQARQQAEETVSDAQRHAGEIIAGAERSMVELQARFQLFRGELEGVKTQLLSSVELMEEHFTQITGAVSQTESALSGLPREELSREAAPAGQEAQTGESRGQAAGENVTFFRPAAEN